MKVLIEIELEVEGECSDETIGQVFSNHNCRTFTSEQFDGSDKWALLVNNVAAKVQKEAK